MGSTKSLKTPVDIDAIMVTKTRALIDAVYDWSRYNTLPRAQGRYRSRWILQKRSPAVSVSRRRLF